MLNAEFSLQHSTFSVLRLRPLRAILRAPLFPPLHADGVERAADDVIADTRQILHAAAANEHQRVLLQVVADPRNVGGDLDPVRQAHARDLPQRRVRLLRSLREDANADAPLRRTVLQRGPLGLLQTLLRSLSPQRAVLR